MRWLALLLILAAAPASAQAPAMRLVSIGTGPADGAYYPVGRAICRIVNRELRGVGIRCSAEATAGSLYNLRLLAGGELDFALIQADVQHAGWTGADEWQGRPTRTLRSVAHLFSEYFTIVAGPEPATTGIADLRGQRILAGLPGSGTRATWERVVAAIGWSGAEQPRTVDVRVDAAGALCAGEIDAIVSVTRHPTVGTTRLLSACATRLVPVEGALVDRILAGNPSFQRAEIAAGTYGLSRALPTFSVASDLMTTERADPAMVAAITRVLVANLTELITLAPALSEVGAEALARPDAIAPLHQAAAGAYRESGARP